MTKDPTDSRPASADRRPVDPPPIVELRIFEGENRQNDITFSYNANFFLFATLENARSIAQGRVQPNPASSPSSPELPLLAWHTLIALRPLVTLFSRTCLFVMKGNTA